ncbi:translocation/assembly module TamB domain-containing protein [Alcanivorax sp. DP30]|uniref:translocation/assembly module TamB domain-containing protein n=1 Tax=Alcanivorax sp. DP30 TaxID=2606217 RepID=UPI00351AFD4D
MIRRAVIGLFALVVLLLVLGSLLIYTLVGTAPGNRWLLAQASTVIPGELTVENWQGNLLGSVELSGIRYHQPSVTVELDHLSARLQLMSLSRGWLTFEHLSVGHLLIQTAPAKTASDDSSPLPDSLALPLGIRIEHLQVSAIQLNDTQLAHGMEGESLSAWRRFQLARLEGQVLEDLLFNASAHGELTSPYTLESRIRWQKPLPASDQISAIQASGELLAKGPLTALQLSHDLQAPLIIHSQGQWLHRDDQWLIDLQHAWQAQPLPLTGDNRLKLASGSLTTRGPLTALQLKGHTALQRSRPEQQDLRLDILLDSSLTGESLNISELTLRQSDQRLTGKGSIQLQPVKWDLALDGDIDTAIFSPQLPGQLSLDGHSKGQLDGSRWQLEPGTLTVTGHLRQQPLTLSARTQGSADNLQIDSNLLWGNNRVQLTGKAWPQWQLTGQLSLADLSQLDATLQGSLTGNLQILGKTNAPRLSGKLVGKHLGQGHLKLQNMQAEFQNLGTGGQTQQLTLSGSTLHQDSRLLLDTIHLAVQGKLNRHELTLGLRNGDTTLETQLDGALSLPANSPLSWTGTLSQTRLQQQHLGQWKQAQPSALALSLARQRLGNFCLQQQQSRLCLDGSLSNGDALTLEASANALPLALLSSLIGPDYSLEGTLNGQASLAGRLAAPSGSLSLNTEGARLTFNVDDGPPPWVLDTLSLNSELDGQQAHTRFVLATALGQINAQASHGFSLEAPMEGQASFRIERLSAVEMLTADLRDVRGTLNGDIQLGGTPGEPVIEGVIALQEGHALIPALGTAISDIDLSLQGSPKGRLAVSGQALMGTGTLKVTGYLDPARWPMALSLKFSGERLLVADRPDAKVWVSPDLSLDGDLQGLQLSGKLLIPEAAIHPEQLPEGAVTVSDDQVLVHQEGDAGQRLPLGMDVTVTLGDKVNFNGFGLNANLGGTLQILQQPQQPPQLNGQLVVVKGRYRAYGQNLAISDGQLIFQGQPDNPGLDIRAYRKIPSEAITVGVQLSGTLQTPEAVLYSDPGMEPSQIMSYLLTGRPLEGGTQSDANRIAQALAVYGLEKGSGVTDKIGEKLGVDEITVGSDWETEDAALMLGKQLSDRLYLTYAIGLFDAVSTVMLRYTLTRSLHLEARSSSEANSLDLIWEKELR